MTPPTVQGRGPVPTLSSRDSGHVPYVWQVLAELSPTTRDTRLDLILSLETPQGLSLVYSTKSTSKGQHMHHLPSWTVSTYIPPARGGDVLC